MQNPELDDNYKTWLDSDYSSGTSLTVLSNATFSANDFIVAGEIGEEKTENRQIASLTGDTTITINSAFRFSHQKDTPIYRTHWDFISLEGRSSSSGNFSELTQLGIQWDKNDTVYFHTDGTDSWQYRFRFYNSHLDEYSEYSPTISGALPDRDTVRFLIDKVREIAQDKDREVVKDPEIIEFFNTAQEIIQSRKKDWWFLRIEDSSITTTQGTFQYNLDTIDGGTAGSPSIKISSIDTVRYHFNDGSQNIRYHLQWLPEIEFDERIKDVDRENDDNVQYYTIRAGDSSSVNGYIDLYPTPDSTNGTLDIRAYRKMARLDTVDDTTLVPIPMILIHYAVGQIEKIRGNDAKSEYYEELFFGPSPQEQDRRRLTGIALLEQTNMKKRPSGQPRQFKRFVGRRAMRRMFADRTVSRDQLVEKYW